MDHDRASRRRLQRGQTHALDRHDVSVAAKEHRFGPGAILARGAVGCKRRSLDSARVPVSGSGAEPEGRGTRRRGLLQLRSHWEPDRVIASEMAAWPTDRKVASLMDGWRLWAKAPSSSTSRGPRLSRERPSTDSAQLLRPLRARSLRLRLQLSDLVAQRRTVALSSRCSGARLADQCWRCVSRNASPALDDRGDDGDGGHLRMYQGRGDR